MFWAVLAFNGSTLIDININVVSYYVCYKVQHRFTRFVSSTLYTALTYNYSKHLKFIWNKLFWLIIYWHGRTSFLFIQMTFYKMPPFRSN